MDELKTKNYCLVALKSCITHLSQQKSNFEPNHSNNLDDYVVDAGMLYNGHSGSLTVQHSTVDENV